MTEKYFLWRGELYLRPIWPSYMGRYLPAVLERPAVAAVLRGADLYWSLALES